jgi:hypothetical protein
MDPAREPLYGDLFEELARGRSRAWFWRQLLYAAGTGAGRRVWEDKRAIAETWAVGGAMLAVLIFSGYVTVKLGMLVVTPAWTSLFARS